MMKTGAAFFLAALRLSSQSSTPDVLIFVDGEKLIGRFLRSNGSSLTFHSDMAGDVTVDWAKVQELHTGRRVAVIEKGVRIHRNSTGSSIPRGTMEMTNQTVYLEAASQAPVAIPVNRTEHVIDESTLDKDVLRTPGLFQEWKGSITAGLGVTQATQQSRTYNTAFTLQRSVPPENWLPPRNRWFVNFNGSYGTLLQPSTPRIKTELFHADSEYDEHFARSFFAFGQAAFDHNFSQGLDLQQRYGGGIGWVAIQAANNELDLKGSVNYLKQQFRVAAENQDLAATTLEQTFRRVLSRGITLQEEFGISAPWNNLNAYTASTSETLTLPVYRRISFTIGVLDTFLNNPPPGFHKNSFQLTTGLTYTLP